MAKQAQYDDGNEQIADTDFEQLHNIADYGWISGCAATYSATDLTVTIAAGKVRVNGLDVTYAGGTVTLVPDATAANYRWAYISIDVTGTARIDHGTAATLGTPPVPPELAIDGTIIHKIKMPGAITTATQATVMLDRRGRSPAFAPTIAYKTGTQIFTTNITFANITADGGGSGGNMAFDVVANGVYAARFVLPITYGGTGGVKLQFTGPAAPTLVRVDAFGQGWSEQSNDSVGNNSEVDVLAHVRLGTAAAFSASFVALDSSGVGAAPGTSGTVRSIAAGTVIVEALIVNGANAGTVTLQGAQNSSNTTTTFAAGCWMKVQRVS